MIRNHCIWRFYLGLAVLLLSVAPVQGQYTMDEIGVNVGGGFAAYSNPVDLLGGPAARANFFYGHYFCGKAYGFQIQGGFQGLFSSSAKGQELFPLLPEGSSVSLTRIQAEIGAFFKLRPRDYHRRKEWAIHVGPVLPLPVWGKYAFDSPTGSSSGPFGDLANTFTFSPLIHLSLQMRRPLDKKSWFFEPGIEIAPTTVFESSSTAFRSVNVFFTFGYAFWEKRG